MNNHEKELFFGMYVDSAKDFKLLRGDRLLILDIVNSLNQFYESNGPEEFAKCFEAPKNYKISKSDTDVFPFGTFYGKKNRQRTTTIELTPDELASQFFSKLKSFYKPYEELQMYRPIAKDIVNIIHLDNGFRADVVCVFCPANDTDIDALMKRYSVQRDKTGAWNFSNLRKHMKHHVKGSTKGENDELNDFPAIHSADRDVNHVKSETNEAVSEFTADDTVKQNMTTQVSQGLI